MNKCKCGCGEDLAYADHRFQLLGYIDGTHRARAEKPMKWKKRPATRKQSPRR